MVNQEWLNGYQHKNKQHTSITSIREDLNSKFNSDNFIIQNNQEINNYLLEEQFRKKSVVITTKRPNKNSVIITTHHKRRKPFYSYHGSNKVSTMYFPSPNILTFPIKYTAASTSSNPIHFTTTSSILRQTSRATTTTRKSTTTTTTQKSPPKNNDNWSIFEFLKNIVQFG